MASCSVREDGGDICQWLPYAEELATTYRVALFDWKEPRSELPVLAAAALREAGAQKVVLGGASYGGALALSEAHKVRPPLAGVLSFGGEITLPGFDGRAGIRKWRGPLLQISSEQDHYFDSQDAQQLRRLHPGPETVVMLPGQTHGVELLDDPAAGPGPRRGRPLPGARPRADLRVGGHRSLRRKDAAASPQTIATHTAAHAR